MKDIRDFPSREPRGIFEYFAPQRLTKDLIQAVFAAYGAAVDFIRRESIDSPEAKDLLPHLRRAYIETVFAEIAGRQRRKSIEVVTGRNRSDNAHRIIKCGPLWITESKVESRYQMPREALFRQSYAEKSQLMLFEVNTHEEISGKGEEVLYGIVVHKPAPGLLGHPEFIDIVFPDRNCEVIVDRIRLCDMHRTVVDGLIEGVGVRAKPLTA